MLCLQLLWLVNSTEGDRFMDEPRKTVVVHPPNDVIDFLVSLEELINDINTEKISESKAKLNLQARKLQLQTVSVNLQYQRAMKWAKGNLPMLAAKTEKANGKEDEKKEENKPN
jgi:hypothetical protein